MNLIASAVEEPGIDEDNARFRGTNTFLQIDRCPAFLIHDSHLDGVGRQSQHLFNGAEDVTGKGHLIGPMHLRLHDIDRPGSRIAPRLQIGQRRGDGHERIHDAFGNVAAIGQPDRRVGHQMANIANQHQRPCLEVRRAAIGSAIGNIVSKLAGDAAPTLGKCFLQRAAHQAKPVGIGQKLVLGIDRCHRILAIHDAGQG